MYVYRKSEWQHLLSDQCGLRMAERHVCMQYLRMMECSSLPRCAPSATSTGGSCRVSRVSEDWPFANLSRSYWVISHLCNDVETTFAAGLCPHDDDDLERREGTLPEGSARVMLLFAFLFSLSLRNQFRG